MIILERLDGLRQSRTSRTWEIWAYVYIEVVCQGHWK